MNQCRWFLLFFFIGCSIFPGTPANVRNLHEHAQDTASDTIARAARLYPITGCYPCTAVMSRQWKHDLQEKCSGTKRDCGKCLTGYHAEKDDDKCEIKKTIKVDNHETSFIPNSANVIIPCIFHENVNCIWQRRGQPLSITGRYKYTNGNGSKTKDCSIQIHEFNGNIDNGEWSCESMATSSSNSVTLVIVNLSSEIVTTIDKHDKFAYVQVEDSIILKCDFSKPNHESIDCVWKRKGDHVNIQGRYTYLKNSWGSDTTLDCTIKLSPVREIDFNVWHCETMADSMHDSKHSTNVNLIQVQSPSIITNPENATSYVNDTTILKCTFDANVICKWKHNGTEVEIARQYHYTEKDDSGERRNCELKISSAQYTDSGKWTCYYFGPPATNQHEGSAWLTVIPRTASIITSPDDAVSLVDGTIILKCTFDANVICKWLHDGNEVVIAGRYHYTEKDDSGERRNCEIQISRARSTDSGKWMCDYVGSPAIKKHGGSARLTVVPRIERKNANEDNVLRSHGISIVLETLRIAIIVCTSILISVSFLL